MTSSTEGKTVVTSLERAGGEQRESMATGDRVCRWEGSFSGLQTTSMTGDMWLWRRFLMSVKTVNLCGADFSDLTSHLPKLLAILCAGSAHSECAA